MSTGNARGREVVAQAGSQYAAAAADLVGLLELPVTLYYEGGISRVRAVEPYSYSHTHRAPRLARTRPKELGHKRALMRRPGETIERSFAHLYVGRDSNVLAECFPTAASATGGRGRHRAAHRD